MADSTSSSLLLPPTPAPRHHYLNLVESKSLRWGASGTVWEVLFFLVTFLLPFKIVAKLHLKGEEGLNSKAFLLGHYLVWSEKGLRVFSKDLKYSCGLCFMSTLRYLPIRIIWFQACWPTNELWRTAPGFFCSTGDAHSYFLYCFIVFSWIFLPRKGNML